MPNQDALDAIDENIGEDEIRKLNGFAYSEARRLGWRRGVEALPGGGQPPDIVEEAIKKAIQGGDEGGHTWDQDKFPNIFDHLIDSVANILTNRVRLKEHEMSSGRVEQAELEQHKVKEENPEERAIQKEKEQRAERQLQQLREAVQDEGDELMEDVLEGILDGELKRSEIALILGVEPKDVTNARKRILRLGRKVVEDA